MMILSVADHLKGLDVTIQPSFPGIRGDGERGVVTQVELWTRDNLAYIAVHVCIPGKDVWSVDEHFRCAPHHVGLKVEIDRELVRKGIEPKLFPVRL